MQLIPSRVQPEDWYSVTLTDLKELGFPTAARKRKLLKLLSERYPSHKWDHTDLLKGRFSQQKRLERAVRSLFPVCCLVPKESLKLTISHVVRQGIEIISNARKEANLINPDTADYLELDMYIPSLELGIEYQVNKEGTICAY